jgi:hypothetical protein
MPSIKEDMFRKQIIILSVKFFSAILIIGLGLISCFYLFVPGYVESTLLPDIMKKSGIELSSVNVRSIGLGGAEISNIKIGVEDGGLLVDSIRLDYTPSGLFNRHINRVVISGISINATYANNKLSITGLDEILNKSADSKEENKTAPPVTIGSIIIVNSALNLVFEDKKFRIPFEISATSFDKNFLPGKVTAKIYPDLQGIYSNDKDGKGWVTVNIGIKDSRRFECDISPLLIDYAGRPVDVQLSGSAEIDKSGVKGEIRAITRSVTENNPPSIEWVTKIGKDSEAVRMQIEGAAAGENASLPIVVSSDNLDYTILSPKIHTILLYSKGVLSGEYTFDFENIGAKNDKMSFSLPGVSIKGIIRQDGDKPARFVSLFSSSSRDIAFNSPDIKANIPEYLIKGEMGYSADKGFTIVTGAGFKRGFMSMQTGALQIKGIAGDIPFSWPLTGSNESGRLHLGEVIYGEYKLGPVDLKTAQKNGNISFNGTVKYPTLPDMTINLKGSTSPFNEISKTEVNMDIPEYKPVSDIDLGKVVPALKGYKFNGIIKTHGEIKLADSTMKSGLDISLEKGTLTNREKKLTLEDVSLNASLNDLLSFQSAPGQKIKIGKVSMGDIAATDLKADFRVESLSSIFIEQAGFKWSGGNINLQSFRVDTQKDEYLITLFCDRLMLADILAQFGVAGVSGGGTVNGRIPVAISKGKIKFEEGFLYSTPGGGGKINIKGTDVFKQGMAPGSPEYVQMDIASEALKAFDYSWVKLSLDSNDGELAVKLQFDGKPENKLPFRYNKDLNSFMRVETSSEGSNFQGISLDVNLKLPLDELLNYKGALDMIN